MTDRARPCVGLASPTAWLLPFLRVLAPWSVVLLGRRVCVLAQRVPALVWLVRRICRRRAAP